MYYSSSSSSREENENDDGSEHQPIYLHSIASPDLSLSHSVESYTNNSARDDQQTISHAANEGATDCPTNGPMNTQDMCQCGTENIDNKKEEKGSTRNLSEFGVTEDDREAISTLLLEEKIVSLMNRVWILETENDAIRSRWKKEEINSYCSNEIRDLYSNPYAADSHDIHDIRHDIHDTRETNTGNDVITDNIHSPRKALNQDDNEDETTLLEQNRMLRMDLAISEDTQERMRVAMVSLENREKRWASRVDELSKQLEDGVNTTNTQKQAIETLRQELETEKNKRKKLQETLLENQAKTKECIDGSKVVVANQSSSTVKAAALISDLSNELKLTMERESKLKEELDIVRRDRDEDETAMKAIHHELSASQAQHKREKNALLKHNEELETLNIDLLKKLDTLEKECNELVTKTIQERNSRQDKEKSEYKDMRSHEKDMRAMEDYLYSLSIKYEKSQKEIASLKKRLASSTSASKEAQSTKQTKQTKQKPPTRARDSSRMSQRTRMQIQHDRISHIVRKNEKDHIIYDDSGRRVDPHLYSSDDDYTSFDEQREEDDFSSNSYSMFPNRAEV